MGKRIDNTECHYLKLLRSAQNVAAFYDRMLAPCGITARQYSLLYEIGEHEGCTVSDLSKSAELDRTTLTRSLKPLFQAGLIEDGKKVGARNSALLLSEQGMETKIQAGKLWQKAQKKLEKEVGIEQLQEVERVLERFVSL